MTNNLELWNKLGKTDPSATKPFKRAGGFSGTAIKPMWAIKRMTEEFGPAGIKWEVGIPEFTTVNGQNGEVLVYCVVWVDLLDLNKPRCRLTGVGGDKVVKYIPANNGRSERWENDDEAFKKAFTDAVMNALKFIGVGADVHMGLFDDSKYVAEMKAEFSEDTPAQKAAPARVPANQLKKEGAWEKRIADFEADLADVQTLKQFDELAASHKAEVIAAGWPDAWVTSLRDKMIEYRKDFISSKTQSIGDIVNDIADTFGGARVVNELHPLEAGE